ncbi:MAG: sterol desaturase family protein [Alphaproteobacteria bacterium]
MDWLYDYGVHAAVNFLLNFVGPDAFLGPLPVLVALALALAVIAVRLRGRRSVGRLLRIAFPRRIFLHRSALHDYALFAINDGLLFVVTGAVLLTPGFVSEALQAAAGWLGWSAPAAAGTPSAVELVLFTLWLTLAWDFSATYAHYLKHRVPLLWEFHKVHHSAAVMTPVTANRRHPLEAVFGGIVSALVLGAAVGLWQLLFGPAVTQPLTILGAAAGVYLWRLLGYNLRHSHVDLLRPVLEPGVHLAGAAPGPPQRRPAPLRHQFRPHLRGLGPAARHAVRAGPRRAGPLRHRRRRHGADGDAARPLPGAVRAERAPARRAVPPPGRAAPGRARLAAQAAAGRRHAVQFARVHRRVPAGGAGRNRAGGAAGWAGPPPSAG